MKKQEQLFYLINSLSKSEKRNIRKNFSNDSNYLKLFDAIDYQDEYDDKKIRELFKNTKFIRQLHVTKNYLTKQILKNLRNDNSTISVDTRLNNYLSEIELLYKKELFDYCLQLIQKAEKLAEQFEKNNYLNLIQNWKRKIYMQQKNIFEHTGEVKKIIDQQATNIKVTSNENKYWELTLEQFDNFEKPLKKREKFFKNNLLLDEKNALSLRGKINYYHIHYSNALISDNSNYGLDNLNKLVELLETNPLRITDDPTSYITTLSNKVSLLLTIKQYDEIPILLKKIREIPEKYEIHNKEKISVKLNLRTYNIELEMYRDLKQFENAEALIDIVQNFLTVNQKSITKNYIVLFYYQFAYIFFMLNNYNKSLRWTNKLLQNDLAKIREDIYLYSRLLNLMIHFELSNNIVLKYAVDATRKSLRKKRSLLNYENVLLRFFSKISMARKEDRKSFFLKLKNDLFAKTDNNKKLDVLDYIDFEEWIGNKLIKY
jgi:hypothetical protein